jgi:murein DD-endopeptidase MepM/ murein hydrolase activator NlpD
MTRTYTVLWWASYKYGWDQWNWWHIWTDIATAEWTPVYAIANWKVLVAKNLTWHGNVISIEHKIRWKIVASDYAHLSKIEVAEWDTVSVWQKIWEVWSTWNSTWNHLHFEIDLQWVSYPYYYDYKTCPHSYYDITETWICFDELAKHTVDPLLFFETNWAILDDIKIETITQPQKIDQPKVINTPPKELNLNLNSDKIDVNIFNQTVSSDFWNTPENVANVQKVFKAIWKYKWDITWNYSDIEETIFNYQVENGIVQVKSDEWAWWFWPKTRIKVKADYDLSLLANGKNSNSLAVEQTLDNWFVDKLISDTDKSINNTSTTPPKQSNTTQPASTTQPTNTTKIQKISKENMLTREQIETIEVNDFLKKYKLDMQFEQIWWNIELWKTNTIKLTVTDLKWKPFKWNMPWWMTFVTDKSKLWVFPEMLYNFTDWKRDIVLTWLKDWNTTLKIKIWNKVVRTYDTKIFNPAVTIYPKWWKIISSENSFIWEAKTWYVLFKDENNRSLLNIKYGWSYKLKWTDWTKICIKRWEMKDLKEINQRRCKPENYLSEVYFSYADSVSWVLAFDYKVSWKNTNIELINNYNNQSFSKKNIVVTKPKWLEKSIYWSEVVSMLDKQIVDWIDRWYFLEDRWLTQDSSVAWIENALKKMKNWNLDKDNIARIDLSLKKLKEENRDKNTTITRKQFLDKVYNYLVFDITGTWNSISYMDLDENYNKKISLVFDKNNTWKDQFWDNYYRPDIPITRWEWAYLLSKVMDRNRKVYVTLK